MSTWTEYIELLFYLSKITYTDYGHSWLSSRRSAVTIGPLRAEVLVYLFVKEMCIPDFMFNVQQSQKPKDSSIYLFYYLQR